MNISFQSEVNALRVEIAGVVDEIAWTTDAPLPPEEVKQRLATVAKSLAQKVQLDLLRMANPEASAREFGEMLTVYESVRFHGDGASVAPLRIDLSGILLSVGGDDLIKRLGTQIDDLDYVPGPPAKERGAVLAKLRDTLRDLERREEGLICEAEAGGVYIARRADADPAIVLGFDPDAQLSEILLPGRQSAGVFSAPTA